MYSNNRHSIEEMENYILMYLEVEKSFRELGKDHGLLLNQSTFMQKVLRYKEHGLSGIQTRSINNHYSKEFKKRIIQEYLEGDLAVRSLAKKYNIPSHETVRSWIIKHTRGEEIKGYSLKPEVFTMKGKKLLEKRRLKLLKIF